MAITEEITLIHNQGLSNKTYEKAEELFDTNYIAQIIMAIVTINAWNRIAVSTNMGSEIAIDTSFSGKPGMTSVGAN